jgi:acylphosphatase
MLDGSMSTRWSSGTAMQPGQFFVLDMKKTQSFSKVVLDSRGSNNDYSRSYEIYVSEDGIDWGDAVVSSTASGPYIAAEFAEQTARYIKVVQADTNSSWWSIHELNVYRDSIPVTSITVTGEDGMAAITTVGGALQMNADVLPGNADDRTVTWAVYNTDDTPTDKAEIGVSGLLTAVKDGTVKVVATANDGSGVIGSAIIAISNQEEVTAPVWVTSITVTGENGAVKISTKRGELQMIAEVLPADADNATVIWAVYDMDGSATDKATINASGLLTAAKNGEVEVVAAATNGSGITGSVQIIISKQGGSSGGFSGYYSIGSNNDDSNNGVVDATIDENGHASAEVGDSDFIAALINAKTGKLKLEVKGAENAKKVSIKLPVDQVNKADESGIKSIEVNTQVLPHLNCLCLYLQIQSVFMILTWK